jgi:hypothetical protein
MSLERYLLRSIERALRQKPDLVSKRHGTAFATKGGVRYLFPLSGKARGNRIKRPSKPTPLQLHHLEEWACAGAVAAVIHLVEELGALLHSLEHPASKMPASIFLQKPPALPQSSVSLAPRASEAD